MSLHRPNPYYHPRPDTAPRFPPTGILPATWGKIARVVLAVLSCLATVSCSRPSEQPPVQELRVGLEDHPRSLDPRYATDAYGMRISHKLIFGTLLEEDYDLNISPGLAERWEMLDDTTCILQLRAGLLFHNGTPMTAEDVKFTFEHLMDPESRSPFGPTLRNEIASIEVTTPRQIVFKLTQPTASFLRSLVLPILPKQIILEQNDFATTLPGCGPFQFVSHSASEIVLQPNRRYYGGAPRIDRLVFKIITDDNTRFLKLRKGELDVLINALPLEKIDEIRRPPLSDTYDVIEEPGLSYNYLAFNLTDPVLRDLRVRQAVAHGIHVDEIIAYRLGGHARRATGLLSDLNPFYESDVPTYPYDPGKAKALLDAAGFPEQPGASPGPRLTLELKTSNNAQAVGIARILQSRLAAIGIRLDLRSYEWGTFYGDIRSGNFQLTTMRWVGIIDPDFYYEVFHSTQTPPRGNNRGHYADQEADRLFELGRITLDFAKRRAVYSAVQKKLAHDLPYVSLWHVNNLSVIHKRVAGYRQHPSGSFLSFRELHIRQP